MGMFDVLTIAANIAKESGKLELQGELLGIYEKLLEQQKKISDLEQDNKELRNKLETKESLISENNAYWSKNNDKKDGPFCTRCWDVEKNTVRLNPNHNLAFHSCPECKTTVQTNPGYTPPYRSRIPPEDYR